MRDDPYITSIEQKMNLEEIGIQHMNHMSKPLLQLTENGPSETLDLEKSRKYIIPKIANVFKKYKDGKMKRITKYYDIKRCDHTNFQS